MKIENNKYYEKHNINHKNIAVLWNYLKHIAKEKGLKKEDIDLFKILNLPFPRTHKSAEVYYTDINYWCEYETYLSIAIKVKELSGDPNAWRNSGRHTSKSRFFDNLKLFYKFLGGPVTALNLAPMYMAEWNKSKTIDLVRTATFEKKGMIITAIFRYGCSPFLDRHDTYPGDALLMGVMESVPTYFPESLLIPWVKLPFGKAKMLMNHHDPIILFSGRYFNHLNLNPHYQNNNLYIRDPNTDEVIAIGKKVICETTNIDDKEVYIGQWSEIDEANGRELKIIGTLINKTITYKGEVICEEGLVMGGPYCIVDYSCKATNTAMKAWKIYFYLFAKNKSLWDYLNAINNNLAAEINEKNKAYHRLKYYTDNLEKIVKDRTEELGQKTEYLRQLDQVVMRVVSHGLGNWSANAISDARLIIKSINSGETCANTNVYLRRLIANCGVGALTAAGLNYYCKDNILVSIQDITEYLLERAKLSSVIVLQVDENVGSLRVGGRVYMILSEIFQNAIKATVNQGYVDRLIMHIGLDTTAGYVTFILINKGKMYGNIQILEAMGDGFPEKHQGGWICRHLATDLKGTIIWAEENDSVKVTLKVPFYVGDEINP